MIRRRTITSYVWNSVSGNKMVILSNCIRNFFRKFELIGNSTQGENPAPDNPQEIKSAGKWNERTQKYEVDVKVTGKNLLDIKDITSETPQWLEIPCLIKNNIYIKSNNSTVLVENNQARLIVCFKDGTSRAMYDDSMTNGLPFKANSENPITTIKVRGTHIKSGVYSGIQVEYGNEPTPYEPYTEQSVQIALDEPLRGIGEYKDTITKDGVVRKILEAPLVKYLKPVINGNVGNRYVFAEMPNANINYDRERCMSNVGFTNSTEKKKYIPHPYQLNFLIRVADDDTIEMVKEKIKDIIVAYTAKEPITEPLPESVQAQLSALHSENGTTHVFVVSGEVECGINIEYKYKS